MMEKRILESLEAMTTYAVESGESWEYVLTSLAQALDKKLMLLEKK